MSGTVTYAAGMRVALCQLPVSPDPSVNLDRVREALADAAGRGADLAVFPEATLARFGSDLRDLGRAVPVGEALAQVDRSGRDRAGGHLGEDRRAEALQPPVE